MIRILFIVSIILGLSTIVDAQVKVSCNQGGPKQQSTFNPSNTPLDDVVTLPPICYCQQTKDRCMFLF